MTSDKTRCEVWVESDRPEDGARHYSMQRIVVTGSRQCSRNATEKVGHIRCCKTHGRLIREGLVSETGQMASRQTISDVRRYPERFPNGLYDWAGCSEGGPSDPTPSAEPPDSPQQ